MEIRVLLDTCAIRSHIHQHPWLLPISELRARLDVIKVSIADSAMAELFEQRVQNRIPNWNERIGEIDSILDPEQPVFPGGSELAVLSGTQLGEEPNREDRTQYYRTGWQLLRDAGDLSELQRPHTFKTSDGRTMRITLDPGRLQNVMADERDAWVAFIERMENILGPDTSPTRKQILDIAQTGLRSQQPTDPPDIADKLDGVVQVLASFIHMRTTGSTPYNPRAEHRRGDVFDWSLLFALPLPAIICTADTTFVNRFRALNSHQASQVVNMEEFSDRVANDSLLELLPHIDIA